MTTTIDTEPTPAEMLDFEERWPRHTGRKETAIIDTLGIAPARVYVLLLSTASSLEGQAMGALTSKRVQRKRQRYGAHESSRDSSRP